jgi:hypothetical protein
MALDAASDSSLEPFAAATWTNVAPSDYMATEVNYMATEVIRDNFREIGVANEASPVGTVCCKST